MIKHFEHFDFSTFWDSGDDALNEYVNEEPTDELIESIESELGYKLPESYIAMMKIQNGGIPRNCCHPTNEPTSWAEDHIAISGIYGIGRLEDYSLCGDYGSQFMIDEWGYPNIGVCVCSCPSAGHDIVMLDYRNCGRQGEPEVVHVDQERNYKITFLAKDFETFIKGLVNEKVYDTSEEDLKSSLESIRSGEFSTTLIQLINVNKSFDFDRILRNLLTELVNKRKYFALHDDKLSYLTYDIQFYLYSFANKVLSIEEYLKEYPKMIAMGDREISTNGYAPDFVKDWLKQRVENKQITKKLFKGYKFSAEFQNDLLRKIEEYK